MNAELFGRIYAVTVNVDSPAGLALDSTYGAEAARLRAQGASCASSGALPSTPRRARSG
jgi:hypothetical protein